MNTAPFFEKMNELFLNERIKQQKEYIADVKQSDKSEARKQELIESATLIKQYLEAELKTIQNQK